MGKYLDIARGVSRPTDTPANEHQNRRAGPPLEARLDRLGIRLAIDKNTGEAYLQTS